MVVGGSRFAVRGSWFVVCGWLVSGADFEDEDEGELEGGGVVA